MLRRLLLLALAALALVPSSAGASALDRAFARATAGVPHAQAALVRDGQVAWSRSTRGTRGSDRFVIASVTKMVVATLALRLVDQGVLRLDDPVERWVERIPNGDRITLRMLLGQRSGLREYFADPAIARGLRDPAHAWTRDQVLDAIRRRGVEAEPGARYAYRNSNYVLLGEVLERAAGVDVEALLQRELSGPLGLGTLSFGAGAGGRLVGAPGTDALGPVWTDGGIASNARDLAVFADAVLGGRVLSAGTTEAMLDDGADGYGMGTYHWGARVGHDGSYGGFTAYAFRDERTSTTLVVLCDRDAPGDPAWRIARALWPVASAGS